MRSDLPSGKFALTYTAKNESRLLPSGIDYHLAAGCSRIYLFWDGTTDNAPELVAKYPQVVARNSYRPDEISNPPQWLAKILLAWGPELDVRKIANTYCAALQAHKDGIEWLACIDADELLLMSKEEMRVEGHISRYLEKVPEKFDQVLMRNLESIPTSADCRNPFIDCIYFLNRFPVTENAWRYSRAALFRATRSPKLIAWYDWLFYELRFAGALKRMMREPGTGRRVPGTYFLGYSSYKSFIRTRVAPDFNFATHSWRRFVRSPRNIETGNVLHFDMLDAAYFAAKFRQRTAGRDIFYLRYLLSNIARDRSTEEIREFFETYIAIRDPQRIARLKKKGIVAEIHAVSELLRQLEDNSPPAAS
jgi:hypothetical protein